MSRTVDLVQRVEDYLQRPHDPIHTMDRFAWSVAIRSKMPWVPRSDAAAAAAVLEQRHGQGSR